MTTYSVSASGTNVTISSGSAQTVTAGSTVSFTVTASSGYILSSTVGGSCAIGSWNGANYTTGPISGDCNVTMSATLESFSVTPSGTNVTISPNGAQTVSYGGTQGFTVTASAGYTLSNTVGGSCPAGSWSGSVYTTGSISADCSVSFSATINSYSITASGQNVSVSPTTASVTYNKTQSFTVTPQTGMQVSSVTGTCPAGSWSGNIYTTGAITANCTIGFSGSTAYYAVTGGGSNVSVTSSYQQIAYNGTATFTVAAATGYTLTNNVSGTCPIGSWAQSGNLYTTGKITAACSVTFSSNINSYTVSASGTNVSISASSNSVPYNTSQTLTVTPHSGFNVSSAVGGTCPAGSWTTQGSVYSTGAIVQDCTVVFNGTVAPPVAQWAILLPTTGWFGVGSTGPMAIDSNGNVFLPTNVGLSSYDSSGNLRWTTTKVGYGHVSFTAVAVDSAGSSYGAAGYMGIEKFDSSGNASTQWSSSFVSDSQQNEDGIIFTSVALDAAGNVYAAGSVTGNGDVWNFGNGVGFKGSYGKNSILVKYSPSGNAQWIVNSSFPSAFGGLNSYDALAIDANGLVYAGGTGGLEIFDSTGSLKSQQALPPITAMALDSSNHLYFATSQVSNLGAITGTIGQYNLLEDLTTWSHSAAGVYFGSVALGSTVIYTAGQLSTNQSLDLGNGIVVPAGNDFHGVLAAYNSSGLTQSVQTDTSSSFDFTQFTSLAVDGSGNLYATASIEAGTTVSFGNNASVSCTSSNSCISLVQLH